MSDTFSKVEVITGVARRRRFTTEQKLAIVAETMQPGMPIELCCPPARAEPKPCVPLEAIDERRGKEAVRADDDVVAREFLTPCRQGGICNVSVHDCCRFASLVHAEISDCV